MFDLKCKRIHCEYNQDCNCTAKDIEVTKATECKTYKPSTEKEENQSEKVGQPPFRKNILVSCKADCLFNQNQQCLANGITVQTCNSTDCPNCCTFEPR